MKVLRFTLRAADLKPRARHGYRPHAAALWLRLVPGLETAGEWGRGQHGALAGATWGTVRNTTTLPTLQQISLNSDKVSAATHESMTSMCINTHNIWSNTAASPIQVSSPIGCQAEMQSPGWSILTCLIKKLGKHAQQS